MSRWIEPIGELGRPQLAPGLKQEEERDEPARAHLTNMTEDGGFVS